MLAQRGRRSAPQTQSPVGLREGPGMQKVLYVRQRENRDMMSRRLQRRGSGDVAVEESRHR